MLPFIYSACIFLFAMQLAACASPTTASNIITNIAASTVMPSPLQAPTPTQTPLPIPRVRIDQQVQVEYHANATDLAASNNGTAFAWTRRDWNSEKQQEIYSGAVFIPAYNLLEQRPLDANSPIAVAVESKQERVILGSVDGAIEIWNARTGLRDQILGNVNGSPTSIALNDDETLVAVGSSGNYENGTGRVTVWNKENPVTVRILSLASDVERVLFGPDKQIYFSTNAKSCERSGGSDGGVFVWQEGSASARQIFSAYGNSVTDFAIHPQGKIIASVGTVQKTRCEGASVVSLSNVSDGSVTRVFTPTIKIENEPPQTLDAFSVAFSPNGKLLAIGDAAGRVQVWDWEMNQVRATSDMDSSQTTRIVFMTDHLLAYYTLDGYVRLFSF
jgi:WD40 repeat protein